MSNLSVLGMVSCIPPRAINVRAFYYLVCERKPGFFVKVKEDQNFNRRNTWSISRIKIYTDMKEILRTILKTKLNLTIKMCFFDTIF